MSDLELTEQFTEEQLEAALAKKREAKVAAENKKRADYEALKEDTINDLCDHAIQLNGYLTQFKQSSFKSLDAIYELLQEYSERHSDGQGSFSLENSGCTFKVSYTKRDQGYFDERSQQAERHIIDFVNTQFADNESVKKLITTLLERKKGKLDIKLVQKLYSMENDYQDTNWQAGIKLLKESWKTTESKSYVRFYQKVGGVYQLINLNLASIGTEAGQSEEPAA